MMRLAVVAFQVYWGRPTLPSRASLLSGSPRLSSSGHLRAQHPSQRRWTYCGVLGRVAWALGLNHLVSGRCAIVARLASLPNLGLHGRKAVKKIERDGIDAASQ
ncbi:hypothetical protein BS78_09G099300 [Paspalum vaginatum]|nr:hypothetical protein BS78_09G099300 [Paspalum vaginatum]